MYKAQAYTQYVKEIYTISMELKFQWAGDKGHENMSQKGSLGDDNEKIEKYFHTTLPLIWTLLI